jgi:hypothetical protein
LSLSSDSHFDTSQCPKSLSGSSGSQLVLSKIDCQVGEVDELELDTELELLLKLELELDNELLEDELVEDEDELELYPNIGLFVHPVSLIRK